MRRRPDAPERHFCRTVNPRLRAGSTPRGAPMRASTLLRRCDWRRARSTISHQRQRRYDDRDNNTPRDVYQHVAGDAEPAGINSSRARLNLPYSYQLVEGRFEAGYEFYERTELSVAYKRQEIERSYTEVDQIGENSYEGALRSRPLDWLQMRVEGGFADRNGSEYMYQSPLFQGFTPEYVGSITDPDELFENNPLLRKNNYADRKRSRVLGRIDLMPIETFSIGLDTTWVDDDYDESTLGLTQRERLSSTVDLSWSPIEILTPTPGSPPTSSSPIWTAGPSVASPRRSIRGATGSSAMRTTCTRPAWARSCTCSTTGCGCAPTMCIRAPIRRSTSAPGRRSRRRRGTSRTSRAGCTIST
jgi:hypothetical protein